MKRIVLNVVLPLLLLGGAAAGARQLVLSADSTERQPQTAVDPLVEVAPVLAYDGPAIVHGNGIVEPAREATIASEVSGRITALSEALVEGGRVSQGDWLVRIDGRAYKLAIAQSRAQVERARADHELEENASEAARREWAAVGEEPTGDARRVALRKPQVDAAAAGINSARGALQQAKLDLRKTTIVAPFNATVVAESVEVGEVVTPGAVLATLVGTDHFWVRLSLPVEDLAWLDFPEGAAPGSSVTVEQSLTSGAKVVRKGSVLRLVGALDDASRTAQVLVEIDAPLDPEPGQLPLLTQAFVSAEVRGRKLHDARIVPRSAIFEGNRVWVIDDEQRLRKRTLTVAVTDDAHVIATDGVAVGEQVVVTPLRLPTEGMRVRVAEPEQDDAGR